MVALMVSAFLFPSCADGVGLPIPLAASARSRAFLPALMVSAFLFPSPHPLAPERSYLTSPVV